MLMVDEAPPDSGQAISLPRSMEVAPLFSWYWWGHFFRLSPGIHWAGVSFCPECCTPNTRKGKPELVGERVVAEGHEPSVAVLDPGSKWPSIECSVWILLSLPDWNV